MKGYGKTQRTVLEHFEQMTATHPGYQPTTHEVAERCGITVDQAKGALKRLRAHDLIGATISSGRIAARWTLLPVVEVIAAA